MKYLIFICLFLASANLAAECRTGNLSEDTKCRLDKLKDTELIFKKHRDWIKRVDAVFTKMLNEEAACRSFKNLYPNISSSDVDFKNKIKKNIAACDSVYKADWLKRFNELAIDYKYIKELFEKMKLAYEANKFEVELLEKEYQEAEKKKNELEGVLK